MTTKERVIKARVEDGLTYTKIRELYGVAKSTAQDWVSNYLEDGDEMFEKEQEVQGYINENLQRDRPQRFKKTEDEVLEFISQLTPITVKNDRIPTRKSLTDFAVVGSDFHFGCEDKKCISIFLDVIDELKPSTIILNGDTMDMLAISKYPKDIKVHWSLLDERKAYHQFLDDLIAVSGGAKIYETYSNHSGQSIQGRWRRYLSDRLGELASLPNISDILSYENVFMGDYQNLVEHVDFVQLNDLVVTHGTTVRSRGGASCIGEVEKWNSSVMHGHTHRCGMSVKRVPAFGNRPEKQLYGFEGGALCSLNAAYGSMMNWQNSFNIVSLDEDGVNFGVENVMINSGVANVATLGKTFRG
jgi:transposase-like protein